MRQTATVSNNMAIDTSKATDILLDRLGTINVKPLWTQMKRVNPPAPNPSAIPHVWQYGELRPNLIEAGELVTEKQAERRVLMVCNPVRGMKRRLWAKM